jgi:transposase
MRKTYPSDVSREQFAEVLPIIESARRKTKPRDLDLYDVFCGVLYVLKGGIQWRMLPEGFPKWRSVYAYFQIWSEEKDGRDSILEQCLKKISWRGSHTQWTESQTKFVYN